MTSAPPPSEGPAAGLTPTPDPSSLAELEALAPRLYGWACLRLRGRPQASAEDLVQEVLCRALASMDRFRGGNLGAWVFQIARNVLLEGLRAGQRQGLVSLPDAQGDSQARGIEAIPESITTLTRKVARLDAVRTMLRLVEEFEPIDRQLVTMCGLEGMTSVAAATVLGLSQDACAQRWYRLRKRLGARFGGELAD